MSLASYSDGRAVHRQADRKISDIPGNGRPRRGLSIALLGSDGAGKSLLAENLASELCNEFPHFDLFHLKPPIFARPRQGPPVTNPHAKPPRSTLFSLFKLTYFLFTYAFGYLVRIKPLISKGHFVIFDRYYHDLLVDPRRFRYSGSIRLVRFLSRFVPSPDLFLILDLSEHAILKRKQELPLRELCRQRRAYRRLGHSLRTAFLLDAAQSPIDVAKAAAAICRSHSDPKRSQKGGPHSRAVQDELTWLSSVIFGNAGARFVARPRFTSRPNAKDSHVFFRARGGRCYLLPCIRREQLAVGLQLYSPHRFTGALLKFTLGTRIGWAGARTLLPGVCIKALSDSVTTSPRTVLDSIRSDLPNTVDTIAVSFGTPGKDRTPVLQLIGGNSKILGYAKLGADSRANALIDHESSTLRSLGDITPSTFVTPHLIACCNLHGRHFFLQSASDNLSAAPKAMNDAYLPVLQEMATINRSNVPLSVAPFWCTLKAQLITAQNHPKYAATTRLVCDLERALQGASLPFYFAHGDFTPWNIRVMDKQLLLFDWEHSLPSAPAGYDLFHFYFQTRQLLSTGFKRRYTSPLFSRPEEQRYLGRYFRNTFVDFVTWPHLFALYLAHRLSVLVQDENFDNRTLHEMLTLARRFSASIPPL